LSRQFKIFDDNNSSTLDLDEFTKAIKDYGVDIEDVDIANLFKTMDLDGNGQIDFNEFLRTIVGEMNQFRSSLVEQAFRTLDKN
jgi:Ca2+-binding EF-hand superfamily protein